ncbi:hypothetical protein HOLleu_01612 [Holothuria leucospilota]|uniref:Uncharacterized protein n=1 Tax=Holothuria leucospilota TaxID=206669 RepID=A0A9Q1CR90_HOLLE|nr:hypothetical protein HOLleu_01612 [Holothuria leucospilota]
MNVNDEANEGSQANQIFDMNVSAPQTPQTPQPRPLTNIAPPPPIQAKEGAAEEWKLFKQMFEGYCIITQLHSHDAVYQKAVFLHCIGPVGVKIYNSLTFADDEDENDIKIIMTKLDTYFIGESNETYERYVFNKRDQQAGETVDAYVANLRTLAKTCNFVDLEESLIKDRLVLGINDPGTRKTLLQTRNLTLQDAVDICKTDEATRNQLKSIDTESVNKVQQKKANGQQRDKKSVPMIHNCKFCGSSHPKRKEDCPAWGKTCKNCGKKNHFAAQCKSAPKSHTQNKQANQINQVEDNQSDDHEWINSIHTEKKDLGCRMEVNNEEVIFQVDTGATVNTLPENMYTTVSLHQQQRHSKCGMALRLRLGASAELNNALLREHYTLPILEETLHELGQSRVFSKADLSSGYWHIQLEYESSLLTTFQTTHGRFRWKRLPFGLSVSPEIFQRKLAEALNGLKEVVCIADDVIIHGKDTKDHEECLTQFLKRCQEKGIKLNKEKLELRLEEVTFMGHRLTNKGLRSDTEKVKAITSMQAPSTIKELRRFLEMVNYLAKFLPNLHKTMKPLQDLTKKDVPWVWSNHQKAFSEIQTMVHNSPVLAFYDPGQELVLENDASEDGLGSAMLQNGKPVAFASRTLTDTERRYAQIEKEMLAVCCGLKKFHLYTYGRQIRVATQKDEILQKLMEVTVKRWPSDKRELSPSLARYYSYRDEITVQDGLAISEERLIIPTAMRLQMKEKIHAGHLGINSCLRRARELIFWSGMSSEIRQFVESCGTCAAFSDKQASEPLFMHPVPSRPWEKVGSDLFTFSGRDYLITVDYYSNFFEVDYLSSTSEAEIGKMKHHFARHGIPDTLISDGGPQYSSEKFRAFSKAWNFSHEMSSPGNSQSNGAAEAAVKTAKRLFQKCRASSQDPYIGLLNQQNTPTEVRTQPIQSDRREWEQGTVTWQLDVRSYEVEANNGGTYRRGRRFLRRCVKSRGEQQQQPTPDNQERGTTPPPSEPPEIPPHQRPQTPPDSGHYITRSGRTVKARERLDL